MALAAPRTSRYKSRSELQATSFLPESDDNLEHPHPKPLEREHIMDQHKLLEPIEERNASWFNSGLIMLSGLMLHGTTGKSPFPWLPGYWVSMSQAFTEFCPRYRKAIFRLWQFLSIIVPTCAWFHSFRLFLWESPVFESSCVCRSPISGFLLSSFLMLWPQAAPNIKQIKPMRLLWITDNWSIVDRRSLLLRCIFAFA